MSRVPNKPSTDEADDPTINTTTITTTEALASGRTRYTTKVTKQIYPPGTTLPLPPSPVPVNGNPQAPRMETNRTNIKTVDPITGLCKTVTTYKRQVLPPLTSHVASSSRTSSQSMTSRQSGNTPRGNDKRSRAQAPAGTAQPMVARPPPRVAQGRQAQPLAPRQGPPPTQSRMPATNKPSVATSQSSSASSMQRCAAAQRQLERDVRHKLQRKSVGGQARAVAADQRVTKIPAPHIMTKDGVKPVLQQMTIKRKVDRRPEAEVVTEHLTGIDVNDRGEATQIDVNVQHFDPFMGTGPTGEMEALSVVSSLTVTASGRTLERTSRRETNKRVEKPILPEEVHKLVQEEIDEVNQTLCQDIPRVVTFVEPESYPLHRKQLEMTLAAESAALLKNPRLTGKSTQPLSADEVQARPPPETISNIMSCLEKGIMWQPNQVFNNLYPEAAGGEYVNVSPVVPGPLQDAVVPTNIPRDFRCDEITPDEEVLLTTMPIPGASFYTDLKLDIPVPKRSSDMRKEPSVKSASMGEGESEMGEQSLLGEPADEAEDELEEMQQSVSQSIGAEPIEEIEFDNTLENLKNGIEYFMDARPAPYGCKVQMRGTHPPAWFPGYLVALPNLTDVVQLARSPNEVFYLAWKCVQPTLFPDDAINVL